MLPALIANAPAPGGWLPYLVGGLGTGLLALWQYILSRKAEQHKIDQGQRQKGHDEATAADLTLAGLNLKTLAEAREQWRKDIHDERLRYNEELTKLRVKLEELQEDNENLKATHVETYMALRSNQEFFDMLKGRSKDGMITFHIEELPPHINLSEISPANVFRRRKKTTTQRIELSLPPDK